MSLVTKNSGRAAYTTPAVTSHYAIHTTQVKNAQYTFSVSGRPKIGARVRRGPDWPQGNNEDGGIGNRGTVISPSTKQQTTVCQTLLMFPTLDNYSVHVEWDDGNREQYEWGDIFPIELVPY